MKAKEIRAMNDNELSARLVELKKELMKINAEVAVATTKNPGRLGQIKRTIAKIYTISNEKKGGQIKA